MVSFFFNLFVSGFKISIRDEYYFRSRSDSSSHKSSPEKSSSSSSSKFFVIELGIHDISILLSNEARKNIDSTSISEQTELKL